MPPSVPRYSYARIREAAEKFLREHHPTKEPPVPIEDILDTKLGMNIVPSAGLIQLGIDAYTMNDLRTIVVDRYFYENNLKRYRFTLAHELGHILMHRDVIRACPRTDKESYMDYVLNTVDGDLHKRLEGDADKFAGLLLVPREKLKATYEAAKSLGIINVDPDPTDLVSRGNVADWLGDIFEVDCPS